MINSNEYIEFFTDEMTVDVGIEAGAKPELNDATGDIYSNHTRKYIGVVITIGEFNYYIPMSSPKDSDYQIAGDSKVIKKSIIPIIRIVVKNSKGEKELKGTLRISHMIPVPETKLELYDIENETDAA